MPVVNEAVRVDLLLHENKLQRYLSRSGQTLSAIQSSIASNLRSNKVVDPVNLSEKTNMLTDTLLILKNSMQGIQAEVQTSREKCYNYDSQSWTDMQSF